MSNLTFVSWNVNSIKARLDHVKRFLTETKPDVLMLQELKGEAFPEADITDLGYQSHTVTQKTYNGVALIAKNGLDVTVIKTALDGDDTDAQARYIEADINGIRTINIYLPNGNPVGEDARHEKFLYKLGWMDRLNARIKKLRAQNIPFLIGGDFNIIPESKDCHDAAAWQGDAAFRPESHKRYRTLLNMGLTDALRTFNQAPQTYSFWDYQKGAWQKNNGIRIDHFLTAPQITDRTQNCEIDKTPRGWDRPSDHTPIVLTLRN